MRKLTASQKIAQLERRVANVERDREIKNLQREISKADNLSLRQLEDLKDQIEELDYDPDYAEYEQAIQSMIVDIEDIRNKKLKDTVGKKFLEEMMRAKTFPEFHKLKMEAHKQGLIGALISLDKAEERKEKESDLFARYLLGFYDPNFKLNVRSRGGEKKGFVTFGDRKHKIRYGKIYKNWFLHINEEVIFGGLPSMVVRFDRFEYSSMISKALKAR
jgi:hypothetical protein